MSDIREISTLLLNALRRRLNPRILLVLLSVIMAVGAYAYVLDRYAPNRNFISQIWRWIWPDSYIFFSGKPGGFYIELGRALEKASENDRTKFYNRVSSGGDANINSVMSTPNSFGLIQEDSLPKDDFRRDKIRFLSHLYLERLHILYDVDAWNEQCQEWNGKHASESEPTNTPCDPIVRENNAFLIHFLQNNLISTGPPGSGSKKIAGYLFNLCGIAPKNDQSRDFETAIRDLAPGTDENGKEKGIVAVFTIAGAPLPLVENHLARTMRRARLMSVDPSLIAKLNKDFDLSLQRANFDGKYDEGNTITTIGSWAFLISSPDVPSSASLRLISLLHGTKNDMTRFRHGVRRQHQLEEFDFFNTYLQQHREQRWTLIHNFMLFVASVALAASAILGFLSWIVSERRRLEFFKRLTNIYLPNNKKLQKGETDAFSRPEIYEDQTNIIEQLIRSISKVIELGEEVQKSYDRGEITMSHYEHLTDTVEKLRTKCQSNFAQRLHELLGRRDLFAEDFLRHYHTAGYIRTDDFLELERKRQAVESSR